MNISQASERSGVPAKTIRYYEEVGLLAPARGLNGYRRFSEADVERLTFLARARALGFGLEACQDLVSLWEVDGSGKSRAAAIRPHLDEIEARIAELRALQDTLRDLATRDG